MTRDTEKSPKQLPINQETLDIIVANVIPTSKYFEVRFDHLEQRIDRMQDDIKDLRTDVEGDIKDFRTDVDNRFNESRTEMNSRFEQADKRLDEFKNDVNLRFEQVDNRFEQVDKRFEQIIASIDRLTDKLENRDQDQRSFTMRMFSISILISFFGVLGVFLKIFKVV
ncbi:hypothetical protein ACOHYD_11630 [Desulfobacterota bacterium M19]